MWSMLLYSEVEDLPRVDYTSIARPDMRERPRLMVSEPRSTPAVPVRSNEQA